MRYSVETAVFLVESRLQRVPGQGGALDARGKFGNAGENLQLAELGVSGTASLPVTRP